MTGLRHWRLVIEGATPVCEDGDGMELRIELVKVVADMMPRLWGVGMKSITINPEASYGVQERAP